MLEVHEYNPDWTIEELVRHALAGTVYIHPLDSTEVAVRLMRYAYISAEEGITFKQVIGNDFGNIH